MWPDNALGMGLHPVKAGVTKPGLRCCPGVQELKSTLVAGGRSGRGVLPGRSWGWFPWGDQRDSGTPPGLGPCCYLFSALATALPAADPLALGNGRAKKNNR